MAGLGDLVKKAFYLGVGVAASAAQSASEKLAELREQAQKLADEMVAKGEITTEEAKRLVDEMVNRAQQQPINPGNTGNSGNNNRSEPRPIEISSDEDLPVKAEGQNVDTLREQVMQLQEELRRLKQE
ncbi:phasin family protein [Floridanema aerugineum]|jgi:polyhydroxyalkanoate synthesis regulator phasin|uniref:Phasin family protein n=1 Tax=Floridaenema aerugineum BLCC-F46 TaxID=3153654 RepID=A0ABV4XB17_9CYAN